MSDEKFEEKLDSPLIVHKVTDASYQETANNIDLSSTHVEEETATLERHRFRKEKKNSKLPVIIAFAAVLVALCCFLYFSGALSNNKEETTAPAETTTEQENRFENTITVKGTYVFYEGVEVDGLQGLISEIKYLDEGTKLTVQNENADETFLSEEILHTLTSYNIEYEVVPIISSGLTSKYETTAPAQTTQQSTTQQATAQQTEAQ